jgi:hypothetical protein
LPAARSPRVLGVANHAYAGPPPVGVIACRALRTSTIRPSAALARSPRASSTRLPGFKCGRAIRQWGTDASLGKSPPQQVVDGFERKLSPRLNFRCGTAVALSHNVINVSKTKPIKLYTIYSPPNYPDGTVHKTKNEVAAVEAAAHHSYQTIGGTLGGTFSRTIATG